MGIQDFYNVIKKHCPEVLVVIKLSQLSGQKIAVDISIFLNKYVKSAGTEKWVDQFIILMCCLKRHGIKPVSIFDGPKPPIEKKQEQERRRAEGAKTKEKIQFAKSIVRKLEKEYVPEEKDIDESLRKDIKGVLARAASKVNYDDIYDVISELKSSIVKRKTKLANITRIYTDCQRDYRNYGFLSLSSSRGGRNIMCRTLLRRNG
ncbi:MAG TPA: hypothetical protein PKD85_00590 [Saprospiraceae bacterium]|nr:hypothetical protein [Saprospiraceae bacterium]